MIFIYDNLYNDIIVISRDCKCKKMFLNLSRECAVFWPLLFQVRYFTCSGSLCIFLIRFSLDLCIQDYIYPKADIWTVLLTALSRISSLQIYDLNRKAWFRYILKLEWWVPAPAISGWFEKGALIILGRKLANRNL